MGSTHGAEEGRTLVERAALFRKEVRTARGRLNALKTGFQSCECDIDAELALIERLDFLLRQAEEESRGLAWTVRLGSPEGSLRLQEANREATLGRG